MFDEDLNRLSRLTAMLTHLQSRKLTTAADLSAAFGVSKRTIYRDIKALEQSGVPIYTEEGKGYALMEGFRLPPVMFTESEAQALITAGKIIEKNKDASLVKAYADAMVKLKAVLKNKTRDNANLLASRIQVRQNASKETTSDHLSTLQSTITSFHAVEMLYHTLNRKSPRSRVVEPFALYTTKDNWILVAYCHLRKEFRAFRLDRIITLKVLDQKFKPHQWSSLEDYLRWCYDHRK